MTREEAIQWLKVINTKEFGWDEFALQESQREIRERCEQGVREAIDMAIEALSNNITGSPNGAIKPSNDVINRADAIKAVAKLQKYDLDERNRLRIYAPWHKPKRIFVETEAIYKCIYTVPSAEAVQGYTEWLEKIVVNNGSNEWLCEDTPDTEWCKKNCHYSSIQAECLRHLYKVSKGGDTE